MSRLARQYSETGLYHVFFRGINKQNLFEEEQDYKIMLQTIEKLKKEMQFEVYAYCLMSNHVHILLKEREIGDISLIMKRLLTKYARWYNIKYKRSGTLIENRYKSKPVEVDQYFLALIRYIHQNPVKAKIVSNAEEYPWSSFNQYINGKESIADIEFVLSMISQKDFAAFHEETDREIFTVNDKMRLSDDEIRRDIIKKYDIDPKQIINFDRNKRNSLLKELKDSYSIRQIERITGISRGIIHKS